MPKIKLSAKERFENIGKTFKKAFHKQASQPVDHNFNFSYLSPADRAVIDAFEAHEVVYAKEQPEYIPLRTLRGNTREVPVLSRWTLTPEQRKAVADGADIFLQLLTFGNPLQPIVMAVSDNPNPDYFRETLQLPCEPESSLLLEKS